MFESKEITRKKKNQRKEIKTARNEYYASAAHRTKIMKFSQISSDRVFQACSPPSNVINIKKFSFHLLICMNHRVLFKESATIFCLYSIFHFILIISFTGVMHFNPYPHAINIMEWNCWINLIIQFEIIWFHL